MHHLILFDIDGTLVTTSRAGMRALVQAGRERFGPGFTADGVEYAGRLDPLIIADLLAANSQEPSPAAVAELAEGYFQHLQRILSDERCGLALPGVHDLLDRLQPLEHVTLGVLTGNYPTSGRIKLRSAGIDPDRFDIAVWGDECRDRPHCRDQLPGLALERFAGLRGRPVEPHRVAVVGDTPHDIACGRAHRCRTLAVATGQSTLDDLAHADLAVEDLSDTHAIAAWLCGDVA